MKKQGQIDTCVKCGRQMKICARGLCNTCYDKDVQSRKIRKCARCGEIRPHHSHGLCEKCYSSHRYYKDTRAWLDSQKRRKLSNPEKAKAYEKRRYQRRKEYHQVRYQKYYADNKHQLIDYQRGYNSRHPGKRAHYTESRKARVRDLPHDLTEEQWQRILREHNYTCHYCGASGVTLHREHKIPVSRGGGYTASNIVPACPTCNMRKHNKTDTEFRDFLKRFPR